MAGARAGGHDGYGLGARGAVGCAVWSNTVCMIHSTHTYSLHVFTPLSFPISHTHIAPRRFDMHYFDDAAAKQRPIMIHRAIFGSLERFFGILIENYMGAFPLWLAPVQVWGGARGARGAV